MLLSQYSPNPFHLYSQTYLHTPVSLVAQWCLTLCSPLYCRPPGSSVHGILQARVLEWVAISSDPGIEPTSSALAGRFFTTEPPGKAKDLTKTPLIIINTFLLFCQHCKLNTYIITYLIFPAKSTCYTSIFLCICAQLESLFNLLLFLALHHQLVQSLPSQVF